MPMWHESHSLQMCAKPPKEQAISLSSSTHTECSVYHPPSWQVVSRPYTSVSSPAARPHPLLAEGATEKREERCLPGEGYFSLSRSPSDKTVCSFFFFCLQLPLIKRRWNRMNLKGLLIRDLCLTFSFLFFSSHARLQKMGNLVMWKGDKSVES